MPVGQQAYTLLEIFVVVAVVGILAAVAVQFVVDGIGELYPRQLGR